MPDRIFYLFVFAVIFLGLHLYNDYCDDCINFSLPEDVILTP
jgi:hypothetical protein